MPENDTIISKLPIGGTGVDDDDLKSSSLPGSGINYIIAIGIDKYNSKTVSDFPYENCKKDCADLIELLISKYIGFQVYKNVLIDENAKKENIITLLQSFADDASANAKENNLVLYFSGHGGDVKQGIGKIGCWIPYGCNEIVYKEVLAYDILTPIIKNLTVHNFLFISDSCNSGKIFDEIRPVNNIADAKDFAGREISSWAIVSSRSNELSKAGGPGKNSKFTSGLMEILAMNMEKQLRVYGIIENLEQYFIDDVTQKPFSGRLHFQNIPNSGHFIFIPNENDLARKKRKVILQEKLMSLNYTDQETYFTKYANKEKKQFAILSGTADCGLNFLSLRVRRTPEFPSDFQIPFRVSPYATSGTGEQKILNIFNLALNTNFPNANLLANHILSILKNQSVIFELFFYNEKQNNDAVARPKDKKELLDDLASFINKINNAFPDDNKLIIFIIDQDSCDYKSLYNDTPIAGIYSIYLPLVTPIKFTDADQWYKEMRKNYIGDIARLKEFESLFKETIFKKLQDMIDETKGFPGSMIRKICKESECEKLAEELLYPKQ